MQGLVSRSRRASFILVAIALPYWGLAPSTASASGVRQASLATAKWNGLLPMQATDSQKKTRQKTRPRRNSHIAAAAQPRRHDVIVGVASFYDDPGPTASGETYDPDAFTAAVQLKLRDKFGGVGYGKKYQPVYGIAEYGGKKLVLKFNDVGPLRPGRKFDLSRAAMAYFGGLDVGLLPGFKVTRLPIGQTYATGPLEEEQKFAGLQTKDDARAAMDSKPEPAPGLHERSTVAETSRPGTAAACPVVLTQGCPLDAGSALIQRSNEPSLFAHLAGAAEQWQWNGDAERFRSVQIAHKRDLDSPRDRQAGWPPADQDSRNMVSLLATGIVDACSMAHEPTRFGKITRAAHGPNGIVRRPFDELLLLPEGKYIRRFDHCSDLAALPSV